MKELVEIVSKLKSKNLLVMDEVLTSTDSLGAISIVMAILEYNAKRGGMSILTVHSRDLEAVKSKELMPSVNFMRAKSDKEGEKFQWEEGIGRANPFKLAKEMGMPDEIIKRAAEIQKKLEEK